MPATPASSVLKSILSLSSSSSRKNKRRHCNSDDDTDDSLPVPAHKLRRMTLDALDPYRYFYTQMTGRGDLLRALGGRDIIRETTPLAAPGDPQFLQRGPRRFGGTQPGSERLNFLPQPDIYSLIKADKILYTQPTNFPVPGFNELIHFDIEQQPGLFFDGQTFELIGELQMYKNDAPWHEGAAAVPENTRKCISPIHNVFASLFKSLTVTVNSQPLITYDYSQHHYYATLLRTNLDDYQNGNLSDQGFFKETAGHMDEWNCYSANGQPATNNNNPARAELCNLFLSGAAKEFRMILRFPISESFDKSPLNSADRLGFTFTRHANTYYLLSGPNGQAAPLENDIATQAASCKIRINKLMLRTRLIEYETSVLENYVNTFTNVQPDAYQFPYHQVEAHTYQANQRSYRFLVVTDTIPDKMAFSFVNKDARMGTLLTNPWIMPRLPRMAKWKISVNNGSREPYSYRSIRQQYDQFQQAVLMNNPRPLISRYDYKINERTAASDCQYNMYCETLTYTGKNRDGSLCLDTRQASVSIEIELLAGTQLSQDNELLVHKWDTRRAALQPNGVIIKDFVR